MPLPDFEICAFWAARAGLFVSFFAYISGYQGPRGEVFGAAVVVALILTATFVPEKYWKPTKHHALIVLRNAASVSLLFFIFYASATTALLINQQALPGFVNLLRSSGLPFWWIHAILFLVIVPNIPYGIKPLIAWTRPQPDERKSEEPRFASDKRANNHPVEGDAGQGN